MKGKWPTNEDIRLIEYGEDRTWKEYVWEVDTKVGRIRLSLHSTSTPIRPIIKIGKDEIALPIGETERGVEKIRKKIGLSYIKSFIYARCH